VSDLPTTPSTSTPNTPLSANTKMAARIRACYRVKPPSSEKLCVASEALKRENRMKTMFVKLDLFLKDFPGKFSAMLVLTDKERGQCLYLCTSPDCTQCCLSCATSSSKQCHSSASAASGQYLQCCTPPTSSQYLQC
jgi:hypothetical protein